MIDRKQLLDDAKKQVKALEADLLDVSREGTEIGTALRDQYRAAFDAKRTGWSDKEWIDDRIAQAAVAWVLACVFVRFLEDNELVADARITGPAARGQHARDVKDHYFRENPAHSDTDYLKWVFEQVAKYPATTSVFDKQHNALWQLPISGDAARSLIEFWRKIDPNSDNKLVHDFSDATLDTRFLGDLYQDLSDHAKKTYALLQTPEFVEEFILDRTLDPAIDEFGLDETTLIDPTCGSGHFLLGAFQRLLGRWRTQEPGTDARELVQRTLHAVHGVDINPFAVAIAKFRLLIAATSACGITTIADSPAFELNIASGDSLLHGHGSNRLDLGAAGATAGTEHWYTTEDADAARSILNKRYSAVVGNPPYITPKDRVLNKEYRARYESCSRQYPLSVPFMERFFDLAIESGGALPSGFVGKITGSSFAKREFGKPLIERFLTSVDVHCVIDSSGAYIPGHGTPTLLLFGRNRKPSSSVIRLVGSIRGEPAAPKDPAQGLAWTDLVLASGGGPQELRFAVGEDVDRSEMARHPWSLRRGGAARLLERLSGLDNKIGDLVESVGLVTMTKEDQVFILPRDVALRKGIESAIRRPAVSGNQIRDWGFRYEDDAVFPYRETLEPVEDLRDFPAAYRHMWRYRTNLASTIGFDGKGKSESGRQWWEYDRLTSHKLGRPVVIYSYISTHNHAMFDAGNKVYKQSSYLIKFHDGDFEELGPGLLGYLNSSLACFYLKQTSHNAGDSTDSAGARVSGGDDWVNTYQFNGTRVSEVPVPAGLPVEESRSLINLANAHSKLMLNLANRILDAKPESAEEEWRCTRERLIAVQEELDWRVYAQAGLLTDAPLADSLDAIPAISLGQRAFEVSLAREVQTGREQTEWFARHRSDPITAVPSHWPEWYRSIVERRIEIIESNSEIALLERPECKRRWATEPWPDLQQRALEGWLIDRLEDATIWRDARPLSCARLADLVFNNSEVQSVAELWAGGDIDPVKAVEKLVGDQSVPYLAQLRYKGGGLATRAVWERTWDLQRQEDEIEAEGLDPATTEAKKKRTVGEIPKPPAYKQGDFLKPAYWKLRGKLDVPKERFISYPGVETADDPSPVIGWAGWNYEQQAQAIGALIDDRERNHAWAGEQLIPLLAGLRELMPWLKQWHSEIDPTYGTSAADDFAQLYESKLHEHGLTENDLDTWRPPASTRGRRARTSA